MGRCRSTNVQQLVENFEALSSMLEDGRTTVRQISDRFNVPSHTVRYFLDTYPEVREAVLRWRERAESAEREHLKQLFIRYNGKQIRVAETLGLTTARVSQMVREHNLLEWLSAQRLAWKELAHTKEIVQIVTRLKAHKYDVEATAASLQTTPNALRQRMMDRSIRLRDLYAKCVREGQRVSVPRIGVGTVVGFAEKAGVPIAVLHVPLPRQRSTAARALTNR